MEVEMTDEELMKAYQLGDENSFAQLYLRFSGRVFSFLRRKLDSDASAKDVLQLTFLKLHRSRSLYSSEYSFAQ
jgi:DNA-directed RNA polymerase specialized sigma24 family protein